MMEMRYVEWVDSASGTRWDLTTEIAKEPVRVIRSVGFVLLDVDDHITLVQSEDPPSVESDLGRSNASNWIVIPRVAITRMENLRAYEAAS